MKRTLIGVAIGTVSLVAGVMSYAHIYGLSLTLHQPPLVALLMPFGIDGLIVVGSVVLLDGNALGWLGIGSGVVISLFANVESGMRYGTLSAVWAGIPALSFALATFIFERWLKSQATDTVTAFVSDAPAAFVPAHAPALDAPAVSVADAPIPDAPSVPRADAPRSATGRTPRAHYRDALSRGELPSIRAIQRDFKVGAPRARAIRAELEAHAQPRLALVGDMA